jgi:hypothetical protein
MNSHFLERVASEKFVVMMRSTMLFIVMFLLISMLGLIFFAAV